MSGSTRTGTPVAVGLDVSPGGRRYVRVTAGASAEGDIQQVVEGSRGLVCLRRVCLDASKAMTCPHAEAAREYLDALDERTTAERLGRVAA